jgi:non-canonical poly(A) RNA polymerase PAPD5/7
MWEALCRRYKANSLFVVVSLANDISSGSYNFQNVKRNLAGAHEILMATIYLRAGILEARRDGQSFSLRTRYEPGDMSILSSVLGVTQEASTRKFAAFLLS